VLAGCRFRAESASPGPSLSFGALYTVLHHEDDIGITTTRSVLTVPEAADAMREFLNERVENLARSLDGSDAHLRALVTASGILGRTITQHFLRLRAFDGAGHDEALKAARGWFASLANNDDAHPTT
jgi:hypothetical protein